jgi:hypothetical protein
MFNNKVIMGTVATLLSTAAFAEPTPTVDSGYGGYAALELSSSAMVGRAGWSESAALSLATSTIPDYHGSKYWHDSRWNSSYGNRASGTVTVSSDSELEGSTDDNVFSLGAPGYLSGLGTGDGPDFGDFLPALGALTDTPEAVLLLPLLAATAPAPEIDFVHEGSVTMSGKTRGGASVGGFGESLGFVDASMTRSLGVEIGYVGADVDGDPVRTPLGASSVSATTSLFGAMEDPDDEVGLMSRVYYGAELSSTRGSKARLNETTVGQKVTASAGGEGDAFTLTREAGDLTLSGRLKGNGLSLFQEADRAAIAGGGVQTDVVISIFEPETVDPNPI